MRRLPVYLLVDTSGSMSGEPIEAVKNGVQVLVSTFLMLWKLLFYRLSRLIARRGRWYL